MTGLLVLGPVALPLAAAVALLACLRWPRVQGGLALIAALGLTALGLGLLATVHNRGVQVVLLGGWPAPFGISFVADLFGALMVVITGVIGVATTAYAMASLDSGRTRFGFYPLTQILLAGVCGAFLTGDLFNLYVWFEVMLIASFVLLALGGERAQLEGAIKYVTLNLMASVIFLTAVGLLYGMAGTLNLAQLAQRVAASPDPGAFTPAALLLFVSFGIKAGVFPLFFWLPASYHTPPIVVSALFAALLTKVGVYALIRIFTLIFVHDVAVIPTLLLGVAALTMITGVLGAIAQNDVRRILSFHIVSQIGYMVLGLALATPMALAGSVFYIAHHIIVKTNLFLVAGIGNRLLGSFELKRLGGLYGAYPWLAAVFAVPALSLAGLPPFSGFFAKLALVNAGLAVHEYLVVGVALGVSLLTLVSMAKIWNEVFWKPMPADVATSLDQRRRLRGTDARVAAMLVPSVGLAAMTMVFGFAAGPVFSIAQDAAAQLSDPRVYVNAVLGNAR